jgi:hypothetical protein
MDKNDMHAPAATTATDNDDGGGRLETYDATMDPEVIQ